MITSIEEGPQTKFERQVLHEYQQYKGKTIGELANEFGIARGAKSFCAQVIRRCLGGKNTDSIFIRLKDRGIPIKTIRLNKKKRPRESMSFRKITYQQIVNETWEKSMLFSQIQRIFIVLLHSDSREHKGNDKLGDAFFWRPMPEQMDGIEEEWELFRNEIKSGMADKMTPQKETHFIHVRTHAQNASDTERAPGMKMVTKKSFWFNKKFVERIVSEHFIEHRKRCVGNHLD